MLIIMLFMVSCKKDEAPSYPDVDREDKIPLDVSKGNPAIDQHPPILYSDEFREPVPVEQEIHDDVSGVWVSRKQQGIWTKPTRVWLNDPGVLSMDDAGNLYFVHHFYTEGVMIEADIYVAHRR